MCINVYRHNEYTYLQDFYNDKCVGYMLKGQNLQQ